MSYQLQYRSLAEELRKAGLEPGSAMRIAKILANSSQPMRSGPVEIDTTPSGIRNVDGNRRKHQLTNLDFRDGDPDYRRRRIQPTENRPRPTPPSAVQSATSPQASDSAFNIASGDFVDVRPRADGVTVSLRIAGTGPFLTQDQSSGSLVGKSIRADCDTGGAGFLRFFIEEQAGEYVLKLQLDPALLLDFVSGVAGVSSTPGGGTASFPTPSASQLAIVGVTLDGSGLCFSRANGERFCLPVVSCSQA